MRPTLRSRSFSASFIIRAKTGPLILQTRNKTAQKLYFKPLLIYAFNNFLRYMIILIWIIYTMMHKTQTLKLVYISVLPLVLTAFKADDLSFETCPITDYMNLWITIKISFKVFLNVKMELQWWKWSIKSDNSPETTSIILFWKYLRKSGKRVFPPKCRFSARFAIWACLYFQLALIMAVAY